MLNFTCPPLPDPTSVLHSPCFPVLNFAPSSPPPPEQVLHSPCFPVLNFSPAPANSPATVLHSPCFPVLNFPEAPPHHTPPVLHSPCFPVLNFRRHGKAFKYKGLRGFPQRKNALMPDAAPAKFCFFPAFRRRCSGGRRRPAGREWRGPCPVAPRARCRFPSGPVFRVR